VSDGGAVAAAAAAAGAAGAGGRVAPSWMTDTRLALLLLLLLLLLLRQTSFLQSQPVYRQDIVKARDTKEKTGVVSLLVFFGGRDL